MRHPGSAAVGEKCGPDSGRSAQKFGHLNSRQGLAVKQLVRVERPNDETDVGTGSIQRQFANPRGPSDFRPQ